MQNLNTKFQVLGQVLICANGCCCGQTNLGAAEVPVEWLKINWKNDKLSKKMQLSFTGCLGPCDVTNVVCILGPTKQYWFGGMTAQNHYETLYEWCKSSVDTGYFLPLPELLEARIFERFISL
ncbi:putative metal-binding protein [Paenibacillus sp. V4I3]|uniref:(2Fe-2S) ferredoxin domain-containing protein n=1 Tax=unclassified Paenibacillus TaxID=185978 RepID=UPI0027858AE4|nr:MULTISPECIES: (2Fe-2S) ferredoxin domain-containing protein [unclassified Paenibacillus]MDQ0875726.1 putative metal-binding protein [Paenibacillus sp. V4I3]MDQ0888204.1 putative metal-binding protein [Paenibacillus sp. V4I9]